MARGEMVRYLALHRVEELSNLKNFDGMGFHFSEKMSSENKFVFLRSN